MDEGTAAFDDTVNPGATNAPNGYDDDCDGTVDLDGSWVDDDRDGFTDAEGDCDDLDGWVHPGEPDICDCKDNDCDAEVDEDCDQDDAPPVADGECGCAAGGSTRGLFGIPLALALVGLRRRRPGA